MIKITHHIAFDFKNREASDLEKLNRILASLRLENLELKNSRGYRAVTQDGDGPLLEKRYGLDSGTLICTPSKNGYGRKCIERANPRRNQSKTVWQARSDGRKEDVSRW